MVKYREEAKARVKTCSELTGRDFGSLEAEADINSIILGPGGDAPYRTPRSNGDDDEENDGAVEDTEEEGEIGAEEEEKENEEEVNEDGGPSDDGYTDGETIMVDAFTSHRRYSSRRRPHVNGSAWDNEPPSKRAKVGTRRGNSPTSRISDIPLSTQEKFIPFAESEEKFAYNFLKDRERNIPSWVQIGQEYAERFQVGRTHQFLRWYINKIDEHPDASLKRNSPHQAYKESCRGRENRDGAS